MKMLLRNAQTYVDYSEGQKNYLHRKKIYRLGITWGRILFLFSFLLLWQIAADRTWIDSFYFSSPTAIMQLFLAKMMNLDLPIHIGITLMESGISFLLIILLALLAASCFWYFPAIGQMLEPFLILLNSLPKSALAPLIIVWMGTGYSTIILCGISVGLFGCILNLYQTFQQTDAERLKLITTLGGNKFQAFTKVVFPGSIPAFISIAKGNVGLAFVGVIIGEFLAGKQGLGYLIIYGSQVFQLDLVILSILILCFIAVLLYGVMNLIEKHLTR